MPGQPNRDYPDRCAPVLSCHRPYCGELRSLCSQPLETDFIGSALTCASWTRAHLMHLTVQCSKPVRAAVMRLISARDWPFGNEAAQGDRVCGSGNDASGGVRRKRRQTLFVADGRRWPGGDRASMPTWHYDSMVNIAHPQRFDIAANYRRWRNACGYRTLAQLEVADATLLLRYQRRSFIALDMRRCDLPGASSEGGSRRALRTR
jgi:hypothetical protein